VRLPQDISKNRSVACTHIPAALGDCKLTVQIVATRNHKEVGRTRFTFDLSLCQANPEDLSLEKCPVTCPEWHKVAAHLGSLIESGASLTVAAGKRGRRVLVGKVPLAPSTNTNSLKSVSTGGTAF
jgi:hypothetical protein